MKTKNILLAIVAVIAFSCKKEDIKVQADRKIAGTGEFSNTPPKTFDPLLMAEKIETYMNGKVAGYGYTIMHEGKPYFLNQGGGGWARHRIDAPNAFRHSYQSRQGIANAAKFVTALATISLLEKYGLSLDEKIYPYLPTNWKPSYEFKQLSFRRLLAHRTGLINYGKNIADYKKTVENGVDMFIYEGGCRIYNDVNYGLAVILLPYLRAKKSNSNTDYTTLISLQNQPLELEEQLIYRFLGTVGITVFQPTGFAYWNKINYTPWGNNGMITAYEASAGYSTVDGSEPGIPKWDERKVAAARGLYISAWEFTQIQSAAAQFKIVSKAGYDAMRAQLLGFDGAVVGAHGKYTWKKGSGDKLESMIYDFGKTQVAVFANSIHSDISDDPSILADAFDESWK